MYAHSIFNHFEGHEDEICSDIKRQYDERFRDYIRHSMSVLAKARPKVIMVDDYFRLILRPAHGCACHLHMNRLSELVGRTVTREELRAHLARSSDEDNPGCFRRDSA